jgi:hypothetical protein
MALKLVINSNVLESNSSENYIHSMPCKIDYDGPAKVSEYFSTYVDKKILINEEEGKQCSLFPC